MDWQQGPEISELELRHGFSVKISTQDLPLVVGRKWWAQIGMKGHTYAFATVDGKPVSMHRFLLAAPRGMLVDHKDGDGLNNTRENIRLCTSTQNLANRGLERRNRLGIKGVQKANRKFRATITTKGRQIHLGVYVTHEEAAAAYRGASIILWGSFAHDPT